MLATLADIPERRFSTDVLIVGGGVAGCNAAMGAREKGASVILVEKGGALERSGNAAAGIVNYTTHFDQDTPGDNPAGFLNHQLKASNGIVAIHLAETYSQEVFKRFKALEKIGINFLNPTSGNYLRLRTFGAAAPYSVQFDGKDFKRLLAREVRRLGVIVLERVMVTDLLFHQAVTGAVGFHVRSGEFYLIEARSVVLATGDALRLFPSPSGFPFNTWHCPYNTGDAQAMALRAGARLASMEFLDVNMIPKGFGSAGTATFTGMGASLVNARGERFMEKYHPRAERAPRPYLVAGIMNETQAGRGPCFINCRHLDRDSLALLLQGCLTDKPTLREYLSQKRIDLSRDPLEVEVSEYHSGGKGGIMIDATCQASLLGLFAAGECSYTGSSISTAATFGYLAGLSAASYASQVEFQPAKREDVATKKERTYAPLLRGQKISARPGVPALRPGELEDLLRQIMADHLVPRRNDGGLKAALAKLERLIREAEGLTVRDLHELLRAHEGLNLLGLGEAIALSALERKETRGWEHVRCDYPDQDDEKWLKFVAVQRKARGLEVSFLPLS